MRLFSCARPALRPAGAATAPHEPFRSSVAALASRSPRFLARSSESGHARAATSDPGCPARRAREPATVHQAQAALA